MPNTHAAAGQRSQAGWTAQWGEWGSIATRKSPGCSAVSPHAQHTSPSTVLATNGRQRTKRAAAVPTPGAGAMPARPVPHALVVLIRR